MMDADTDRSYLVNSCEHGVWIMGRYAPVDETSALMQAWNRRGLRYVSREVAKRLGALVAVVAHIGDEATWLEELEKPT